MIRRPSAFRGFVGIAMVTAAGAFLLPLSRQAQDLTKPLQYEVSVVLKLIHVYVTDKKGKPVEDLALNERSFSRLPLNFPMMALTFAPGAESRVEIVARIPGEVTDKFSGERVEYVALVFDGKNNIRDMRRLEDAPRPRRGQAVVFTSGATLEPGDYTCRLVIRDMESGLSAARRPEARNAPPARGPRFQNVGQRPDRPGYRGGLTADAPLWRQTDRAEGTR